MNIVLLSLNSRYIHLSPAPYYLAAALLDTPHSVKILDRNINEREEEVLKAVLRLSPDVLGVSVYIWNVTYLRSLLPKIKAALPHTRIVLGGPEVSYRAEQTLLAHPEIDAVLSGEGEEPFRDYVNAISEEKDLGGIAGLSYRGEDRLFIGEPYIGDGTPKSPLEAGYAEALSGRIAYIEASRGCPFSCAFCLSGRCGGVRYFDIEQVKKDILRLSQVSRTVKFVDRTFNADRARACEILSFILARYGKEIPEGTCFHFELSGALLEEEQLSLFAKAPRGAFQVEIGVQSFHAPTLRAIRRSVHTEKLSENIRRLLQNGNVHVHIDLIAGLPEESLADFQRSFDKAYALFPHMLQLGFLKLLHGAPLRENREEYPSAFDEAPPYEVRSTPVLSEEDLVVIHTVEKGLDRVYNSARYRRTLALWQKDGNESSPFHLFRALGEALSALKRGYTVNDEISLLYAFFLKRGLDADSLRDAMLLDFISTNSSRLMPSALRADDPLYGRVKHALAMRYPLRKDTRRAVALLKHSKEAAFVDYTEKDPVTHEYPLVLLPLTEILV